MPLQKVTTPSGVHTTLLIIRSVCVEFRTIKRSHETVVNKAWIRRTFSSKLNTVFTGYHSFITLGKQFDDHSCKLFTLSRGGEQRGLLQSANKTWTFSKALMKHMACVFTGKQRKCTRGGRSPWKTQPCNSEPSMLMPFGNTVRGIFSSALMCPLRDSSVQRSSHLEAPLSKWSQQPSTLIHWPFCINASAVTKHPSPSLHCITCPKRPLKV